MVFAQTASLLNCRKQIQLQSPAKLISYSMNKSPSSELTYFWNCFLPWAVNFFISLPVHQANRSLVTHVSLAEVMGSHLTRNRETGQISGTRSTLICMGELADAQMMFFWPPSPLSAKSSNKLIITGRV